MKLVVRLAQTDFDSDPKWYVEPEGAGHMQHIAEFFLESDARAFVQLRTAGDALADALREIQRGKTAEDNTHPLGEYFSMSSRFMRIAKEALAAWEAAKK